VAYTAAKAREALGAEPERLVLRCSGNVIKNVMGVVIPHSGGRRGVDTAAILGALGGDPRAGLEVLETVTQEEIDRVDGLLRAGYCQCTLAKGVDKLFVSVRAEAGGHWALAELESRHTDITRIIRDGEVLFSRPTQSTETIRRDDLTLDDIFTYAETEDIAVLRSLLEPQVRLNRAIAREGLSHAYGARVGQTILARNPQRADVRACAAAAAASDARMGGCSLPVIINSGSGNQGITVSVPVTEYALALGAGEEKLYRALAISNLVSLHQKRYIGTLSAFCGVVCAACGAGTAITYLQGGTRRQMEQTITNTLGTVSGMVCDGAKSSCAAKIATAVRTAILAGEMARSEACFQPGEGLVLDTAEETIRAVGALGRDGMRETDEVVLELMLHRGMAK
jgi:L-cysteine desulfidase